MYEYLRDKSVLYVEDESDVLANISNLLSNFFDNFYTANNGLEALDIFYEKELDILLVDIELPKMSGIEFIREVRKVNEDIKIIIISAYTNTDYLLESTELGLSKYIVKPLTSSKIHNILDTINTYYATHNKEIELCGAKILQSSYTIEFGNKKYDLTKKELQFLKKLLQDKIVSYDMIYEMWYDYLPTNNAIRSFVKHLRKKLPEDILKNKSGVGYYIKCSNEDKS